MLEINIMQFIDTQVNFQTLNNSYKYLYLQVHEDIEIEWGNVSLLDADQKVTKCNKWI